MPSRSNNRYDLVVTGEVEQAMLDLLEDMWDQIQKTLAALRTEPIPSWAQPIHGLPDTYYIVVATCRIRYAVDSTNRRVEVINLQIQNW